LGLGVLFITSFVIANPSIALWLRFAATLVATIMAWAILLRLPTGLERPTVLPPGIALLFRQGFPFMLLSASTVLMSRTDIFFLGIIEGPKEVGIYNVAFQAAVLVDFGLQISGLITTQEFARFHAAGRHAELQRFARNTARFNLAIGIGVMITLVTFGRPLLRILFGPEFLSAYPLLVILAAGKGLSLLFGEAGFILNMSGNERTTVRIFGATALLNVVLCLAAISLFGAVGAAIASGLSLLVLRVLAWRAVRAKVDVSCAVF
jgi:O-antigen/teichoic acid export membrane protein